MTYRALLLRTYQMLDRVIAGDTFECPRCGENGLRVGETCWRRCEEKRAQFIEDQRLRREAYADLSDGMTPMDEPDPERRKVAR